MYRRPRPTHLSLKALRIRSTSSSRWKADASRLKSLSISASDVLAGGGIALLEEGVEAAAVEEEAMVVEEQVNRLIGDPESASRTDTTEGTLGHVFVSLFIVAWASLVGEYV